MLAHFPIDSSFSNRTLKLDSSVCFCLSLLAFQTPGGMEHQILLVLFKARFQALPHACCKPVPTGLGTTWHSQVYHSNNLFSVLIAFPALVLKYPDENNERGNNLWVDAVH